MKPAEPVITAAALSGAIIALLSVLGVGGIDPSAVETIIAAALPLALSFFARAKVTPAP